MSNVLQQTFSTNKVASVAPSDRVAAALAHGVGGVSAAVRPPRVEVAIMGALCVGSDRTLLNESGVVGIVALAEEVERRSDNAGDSRQGEEEGLDSNHGERRWIAW